MKTFWAAIKNYQTLIAVAVGSIAIVAATWKVLGDPIVCEIVDRENKPIVERLDRLIETIDWQTFVQVQTMDPDSLDALGRKWRMMRNHNAKP